MAGRFSAKQERCIKKVKAKGHDKVSAIKICQSRIKKKDIIIMAGTNRKRKAKKTRQQKKRRARLKEQRMLKKAQEEELIADGESEDEEIVVDESIEEMLEKEYDEEDVDEIADIIGSLSDEELDALAEEVSDDPVVQKHYLEPFSGATSFDELEQEREARDKTSKARAVAWDAEDIIGNVIRDPQLKSSEKTKKISQAAKDMEARINSVLGETKEIEPIIDPSPSEAIGVLVKSVIKKISLKKKNTDPSLFIVSKDLNGDLRWVGKTTNRWIDKENDILTDASHKEYMEYLDANPDMAPSLLPWHNLKAAFTHPADSWMYKNGFVFFSGKLEEDEAISLIKASEETELGMSHGFFALERDLINRKNITKYRTFEVSVLPLHNAANPFTELEVIAKEANVKQKAFLENLLGEEKFKKLLEDAEIDEQTLDSSGVKTKDVEDEAQENEVIKKIGEELGMPELSEAFVEMTKELKDLREGSATRDKLIVAMAEKLEISEKEKEDELAEMIKPQPAAYAWMNKASESDDNIVNEKDESDKELVDGAPQLKGADQHWLSSVSGTAPIKEEVPA